MQYRINLPEGHEFHGHNYVVVETTSERDARLTVVRATGVAVAKQGNAYVKGLITRDGYAIEGVADNVESFDAWIPVGIADVLLAQQ